MSMVTLIQVAKGSKLTISFLRVSYGDIYCGSNIRVCG